MRYAILCDVVSCQVNRHKSHLLWYMLFLRISPVIPNWLTNIAAPIVGVPVHTFMMVRCNGRMVSWQGTYIGLIPATLLATRAGVAVQRLTTLQGYVDGMCTLIFRQGWTEFTVLTILSVISLLPTLFSKQLKQRFDSNYGDKESQSPSIDLKKQRWRWWPELLMYYNTPHTSHTAK